MIEMEELKNRLLIKYNDIISELEQVDILCRTTLEEATIKEKYSENDIELLSIFANDNHRRLQFAIAERELILKK
jgi:hypothetical protein